MTSPVPPAPDSWVSTDQRLATGAALSPPGGPPPVVHLRGELDLATEASTRAALQLWTSTGALHLVVVTSAVTFVDCAGLRPLREVAAVLAVRGGCVELSTPSRSVVRLVRLSGASTGLALPGAR